MLVKLLALEVSLIYCRLRNTSLLGEAAIYRCFCNVVVVVVVVIAADVVVVAIVVVFVVNVVHVEKQKPVDRSCHLHKNFILCEKFVCREHKLFEVEKSDAPTKRNRPVSLAIFKMKKSSDEMKRGVTRVMKISVNQSL